MMKKEITYPFNAIDGQGASYIFNRTDDNVEIIFPDGCKQLAEGDELAAIAMAFKKYQLKLHVAGQLVEVLRPTNFAMAYIVLYGKGSVIQIADTFGNVYESRGMFNFVRTDTYEAFTALPKDREYLTGHMLATYTEGMHPTRTDDVTDMDG